MVSERSERIVQRLVVRRGGEDIAAMAVDFNGQELPVYILDPPPESERPPDWRPTLICPECQDGTLRRGQNTGPNNSRLYFCEATGCGVKWQRTDTMLRGIVLEMA